MRSAHKAEALTAVCRFPIIQQDLARQATDVIDEYRRKLADSENVPIRSTMITHIAERAAKIVEAADLPSTPMVPYPYLGAVPMRAALIELVALDKARRKGSST